MGQSLQQNDRLAISFTRSAFCDVGIVSDWIGRSFARLFQVDMKHMVYVRCAVRGEEFPRRRNRGNTVVVVIDGELNNRFLFRKHSGYSVGRGGLQ